MRITFVKVIAIFYLISFSSYAQDLDSLMNLSAFTEESDLQKVLNKNLTVSSAKALTTRETPGIISLITAEEIRNSGARDLTDILRIVPGFDVAQDLQFVLGISLRGNWANEGKVLVMLDGQPFNDLLYQTVAVGNRFPVDAIERIEIIRGPGSAIYGGSAEYGVINIVTKAAETLNGVNVYGVGGFHENSIGRTNAGVMLAMREDDFQWDASVFKGKGTITDDDSYYDLGGSEKIDLKDQTYSDPMNLNAGFRFKGLSVRTMYDVFETADMYNFVAYKNFFSELKYTIKASPRLTITPKLKYYDQKPWTWGDKPTDEKYFYVRATRKHAELEGVYDLTRKINLDAGVVFFEDTGKDLLGTNMFGGEESLSLTNFAFYFQSLLRHRLANATVGFRYEKNNRYGSAFVPRLALTKKIENFHFKLLYSQAFRAPSIQNINLALTGKAKPEKSNVIEVELGYQFTPEMLLAINTFSLTTKDILLYGSEGTDEAFTEWYENATKSGTRGVELVYSVRKKKFYTNFTYSFSQAIKGDESIAPLVVPQTSKQYMGMLAHKATLNGAYFFRPDVSFNPTVVYGGKRYAYTAVDDAGDPVATELDPYVYLNAFLNYNNCFIPGLTVGVGAFDILNARPSIPQAYNGGYASIPGRSREYVVKLSFQLDFKKQTP